MPGVHIVTDSGSDLSPEDAAALGVTVVPLSIRFGDLWAAQDGAIAASYDERRMSAYMKNPELEISVDVGVGRASAAMWTCDLTKRYVEINGDYRS